MVRQARGTRRSAPDVGENADRAVGGTTARSAPADEAPSGSRGPATFGAMRRALVLMLGLALVAGCGDDGGRGVPDTGTPVDTGPGDAGSDGSPAGL